MKSFVDAGELLAKRFVRHGLRAEADQHGLKLSLFLNAAGMVVKVGGHVSHGALVARENGLPAVVSVLGVTDSIEDSHHIRVDGTQGTVVILGDQPDE